MSIVFLFDENPDVASAGSGGAVVGGARSVPDRAARSNSERAAAFGLRWQPVWALKPFGIDRVGARESAPGALVASQPIGGCGSWVTAK